MRIVLLCLLFVSAVAHADTIEHYMNIANNIPKMEMKADSQAQAWARSARNILIITSETIAETLVQANEQAQSANQPLFCLPKGQNLSAAVMDGLIQNTYRQLSSQQNDKNQMTVSQIALIAVQKAYPCSKSNHLPTKMEHMSAFPSS